MKILLRHTARRVFYAGGNGWTDNSADALAFESGDKAIEHAFKLQLREVETVYYFGNPRLDLSVPIATGIVKPSVDPPAP